MVVFNCWIIIHSNNNGINHAVQAVGWGSEERTADGGWKSCTSGADCIPYWIIKNSWGKWGLNGSGFGKIKRGTCGINGYGAVSLKAVKTTGVADAVPEGNCYFMKSLSFYQYKLGRFLKTILPIIILNHFWFWFRSHNL